MGIGDELLAAGHARRMRLTDPRPVRILDKRGQRRWHEIWNANPDIAVALATNVQKLQNGPGCRPYINHDLSTPRRWVWKKYEPYPANLPTVKPDERGRGMVLIEPHIKEGASPNKQWGRWHE